MKKWLKYCSIISIVWVLMWFIVTGFGYQKYVDDVKINGFSKENITIDLMPPLPDLIRSDVHRFIDSNFYTFGSYPILYWKDKNTGKAIDPFFGCISNQCFISVNRKDRIINEIINNYNTGKIVPVLTIYFPALFTIILIPILLLFILSGLGFFLIQHYRKR